MSFSDYNIEPRCLRVLTNQKITEPTPVQAESIPPALEGRDLIAIAQTGTGKTLAFALPALTRLAADKPRHTAMLVIAPTRELAHQVHVVIRDMAKPLGLTTACVYGGVGMEPQTRALRKGTNVIVATPGRLLDHIERGNARLNKLSVLVMDEADRMLDMGFLPDIKRIVARTPKERQTLMFSATFPKNIERMASDMLRKPHRIEIGMVATPADAVRQGVYTVAQTAKLGLLSDILKRTEVGPAVVFMRTKRRTDRVARALNKDGFKAQAIHGDRSQQQRQKAIDGFRKGRFNVLVATDVAARGLDVQGITHVVNYDIPQSPDDYIHRIGRTARASAEGDAITFVSPDDCVALGDIERSLGRNIPREEWDGAVPVVSTYNKNAKVQKRNSNKRFRGSFKRGGNSRPRARARR
jgi:ATP-dependent RNA helicase RhlE